MTPIPSQIGAYRIVSRLGASATNDVYLAVSQGPFGFERPVVLKRQRRIDCDFEPSLLAREAQISAHLEHPSIVRLYDFFEHEGHLVLVREYVEGVPLEALLAVLQGAGERLDDAAVCFIGARLFGALAVAHTARDPKSGEYAPVIHRDVTPSNVLVPWDGFVKLADFGFAKVCGRASETASGSLKGSLGYMAPEQVAGDPVTARTDVYAGALVVREMLVGMPAFPRGLPELETMRLMAEPQLPPLTSLRPDLPPALSLALSRALEPDPDHRAMTAEHMQRVLREHVRDMDEARHSLVATLFRLRTILLARSGPPRITPLTPLRVHAAPPVPESLPSVPIGIDSTPTFAVPQPRPPITSTQIALSPQPTPQNLVRSVAPPRGSRRGTAAALIAATLALVGTGAVFVLRAGAEARSVGSSSLLPSGTFGPTPMKTKKKLAEAPSAVAPKPSAIAPAPSVVAPAPSVVAPAPSAIAPTTGLLHTPPEASDHRVFVDGRFACASGKTITLACGPHVVKVGSMGRPQKIVVPCGGELAVQPKW